jgi:alpha-amylase
MVRIPSFTLASAALATLATLASAASLEDWRSQSVYQVMVDRFARTDGSTDADCVVYDFCNGTWAGLINKLDYIQGMHSHFHFLSVYLLALGHGC